MSQQTLARIRNVGASFSLQTALKCLDRQKPEPAEELQPSGSHISKLSSGAELQIKARYNLACCIWKKVDTIAEKLTYGSGNANKLTEFIWRFGFNSAQSGHPSW